MATLLNAATISVAETLSLLEGPFASFTKAFCNGQYSLWVGSGVSRGVVDGVDGILVRALEFMRSRISPHDPACVYRRGLAEALDLTTLRPDERSTIDFARPVEEWHLRQVILTSLTTRYSDFFSIRIKGQTVDHLLWDGVGVIRTFGAKALKPDAEHYCIALMALEGVTPTIATSNWDDLIERAMDRMTSNPQAVLRTCVDAEQLRQSPLQTRLLKFHGCARMAADDEARYRPMLVVRKTQLSEWIQNPNYAVMKAELTSLAAARPAFVVGLAAQDENIRAVFSAANIQKRLWPSEPPAAVFAEDQLRPDQTAILAMTYSNFATSEDAIKEAALLRAFAKTSLFSLTLCVLCSKIEAYAAQVQAPKIGPADTLLLAAGLKLVQTKVAIAAGMAQAQFVKRALLSVATLLSFFRNGTRPAAYIPISNCATGMIANDAALTTSGTREFALALELLGFGEASKEWTLNFVDPTTPEEGLISIQSAGYTAKLFFAATGQVHGNLIKAGLAQESDGDAVLIHSTTFPQRRASSPSSVYGRSLLPRIREVCIADLALEAESAHHLLALFKGVTGL